MIVWGAVVVRIPTSKEILENPKRAEFVCRGEVRDDSELEVGENKALIVAIKVLNC